MLVRVFSNINVSVILGINLPLPEAFSNLVLEHTSAQKLFTLRMCHPTLYHSCTNITSKAKPTLIS